MKAAIISLGSGSSKMTVDAMKKVFSVVDELNLRKTEANLDAKEMNVLYEGKEIQKYDCIYAKGSFRYANLLRALTFQLEQSSYLPIKADSFTIGHDKILTHLILLQHRIPQPKTYLISSLDAAKDILEKVNYPIMFKFPQGTQGKGVMYAESATSAKSLIDALESLKQPFLIQEFVETGGVDIRAFVVGNKVVAAMKRKAALGESRANIHAGGVGEKLLLDFTSNNVAVKAAEAVGAEICAVDMLSTPRGPVVIEVNLSPGLQGITETTGIDVADYIAKFLYKKASERVLSGKREKEKKVMNEINVTLNNAPKQIITNLDFRGERILLPKLLTDITKITANDEVIISASKNVFSIKKFSKVK